MNTKRKFQYTLEPILLGRKWDLDALLVELGHINAALLRARKEITSIQEDIDLLASEWELQTEKSVHIPLDRYTVMTRYLSHLGRQRMLKEKTVVDLERTRDQLIDRALAARQNLKAIEQHRDEIHAGFIKDRLNGEYRLADDQWTSLEPHKGKNAH